MAHSKVSRIDLSAKIREYEQFANDVLKVDLQKAVEQRAKYQLEIEELEELRRNVQQLLKRQQVSSAALQRSLVSIVAICQGGSAVLQAAPVPAVHSRLPADCGSLQSTVC